MSYEVRRLEELCSLIADCPHSTPAWTDSGYVVIRNQNIKGGRLDLRAPSYTDRAHFLQRIRRARPQPGDIIITREAPMGEVCMVPPGLECCLGQRQVLLRPDARAVNGRYLLYALQSPYVQHQIGSHDGAGSTVSNLRIPVLKALRVPVPPRAVQEGIVALLGALDDRIEGLTSQSAALGEIAQAIFRSWFVDFDPVRAKAEGREPEGVDADTAALFPDGFDETGRTAVPRGWRRGVLGDILFDWTERVGSRSVPVLSAVNSGELVPSKEVFRKQVHSTNTSHYKVVPPFAFAYNPSRINIGSIGLNETGQDGAVSPVYVVCRPVSVPVAYYVWHLLRTPAIREWINVLSSGTVRQNLTYRDFASIPVVIPPDELLERFLSIRSTLYRRVAHNQRMIDTLTALRAELLPRLISGKLRVPEAEEALKEVL